MKTAKKSDKKNSSELFDLAQTALKNSYSPYSGCKIGASLKLKNGELFSGTNIENASYGATICAERTAIFKALSEFPKQKIVELCVTTDGEDAWPPCGLCRQVMSEFCTPDTQILVGNKSGVQKIYRFSELMPAAFTPEYL